MAKRLQLSGNLVDIRSFTAISKIAPEGYRMNLNENIIKYRQFWLISTDGSA
jgi:hypothetical protein